MDDLAVLEGIFQEELDNPSLKIKREMSQEDLQTWDSLAHVRIIAHIEERFGFQFSLAQIEEATSVGALMDVITVSKA